MNARIQQNINHFRMVMNDKEKKVNIKVGPAKPDSLSDYIKSEADARYFLSALKAAADEARKAV